MEGVLTTLSYKNAHTRFIGRGPPSVTIMSELPSWGKGIAIQAFEYGSLLQNKPVVQIFGTDTCCLCSCQMGY